MVRYLKSWIENIDDQQALDRFVAIEMLLARLHFPVSVCFALGVLAQTGLVPYIAPHEWRLVLVASFFLTLTNGRDLTHCIRHFHQVQSNESHTLHTWESVTRKERSGVGGQMQMLGAFALTLGSVSLLNASIIALIRDNPVSQIASRRQYAASFALFLIGSGANGVLPSDTTTSLESYRILTCFQNLLAAATLCTASVLLLPEIGTEGKMGSFQTTLLAVLSCIGCIMLVMSSIVHYFYALGHCTLHYEAFSLLKEERKSQIGRRRSRMAAWETVKGMLWSRSYSWWKKRESHRRRTRYTRSNTNLDHSTDEENQGENDDDSESSKCSSSLMSASPSRESFSTTYDEETGSRSSFVSEESEDQQPRTSREEKRKRDRHVSHS